LIPGKANGNECFYASEGRVQCTDKFNLILKGALSYHPEGLPHGSEFGASYWCAIANTEYGMIPGKAAAKGNICEYIYEDEIFRTKDFQYITGTL
jgi:hypothetical protein